MCKIRDIFELNRFENASFVLLLLWYNSIIIMPTIYIHDSIFEFFQEHLDANPELPFVSAEEYMVDTIKREVHERPSKPCTPITCLSINSINKIFQKFLCVSNFLLIHFSWNV